MRTLQVMKRVGESVLGTAAFSSRFAGVPVGKMAPMLRKAEDPEGLARCGFLEPSVPSELNLIATGLIRSRMIQLLPAVPVGTDWLAPERMLEGRPSIGYVPPELLTEPNPEGLAAM